MERPRTTPETARKAQGVPPRPSSPKLTATAAEVAALLGIAEGTFREKRARLTAEHGFPPRLPGCNAWSLPAVRRWIATNGGTYMPADLHPLHTVDAGPLSLDTLNPEASQLLSDYGRKSA
ncbi:helix-turn-helix transcriptional regulator [Stappia indica]|uniref:helix-turn-helix transcriptional regulator n=1 Tax=Stappia indica TaxID=538381 RepID=UPI00082D79F7|nr:hypothetical protein [Stappia indica]